jgi:hypothetical protein
LELTKDYRKRHTSHPSYGFHNPDYIIEGIGSVADGLLSNTTPLLSCAYYYWEHICYHENGTVKYLNPRYTECLPTKLLPVGIENLVNKADIELYPNPVGNALHIESKLGNNKIIRLKVFDITGQVVIEKQLTENESIIDFTVMVGLYNAMLIDNTR